VRLRGDASGQGPQGNDERKMRLEDPQQLIVGGHEFTLLPFGQGNVQTIQDTAAGLRRDVGGPVEEWIVRAQQGHITQDVGQQPPGLAHRNELLPFRFREGAGRFSGKDGWG